MCLSFCPIVTEFSCSHTLSWVKLVNTDHSVACTHILFFQPPLKFCSCILIGTDTQTPVSSTRYSLLSFLVCVVCLTSGSPHLLRGISSFPNIRHLSCSFLSYVSFPIIFCRCSIRLLVFLVVRSRFPLVLTTPTPPWTTPVVLMETYLWIFSLRYNPSTVQHFSSFRLSSYICFNHGHFPFFLQ